MSTVPIEYIFFYKSELGFIVSDLDHQWFSSLVAVQVNFHKGDGLKIVFLSFLIDDIDIFMILSFIAFKWWHTWVSTWPGPDLQSIFHPWFTTIQRPAKGEVHSWGKQHHI